jgi:SAM-dependent methyltransferase
VTPLYDALNGWGPDYDYWLALTGDLAPAHLTDLGCGTGQLTVLLAKQDARTVLGFDPDPAMLAVARQRDGHELVAWLEGDASDIPDASTDLITMTSHVSQVFLTDDDWLSALGHLRRGLRPSGHLTFDMRNLLARGWEEWNPIDSRRQVQGEDGTVEVWHEVTSVGDGLVSFDTTAQPLAGGASTTDTDVLRFRDEAQLRQSLTASGFRVVHVHGDWDGSPATEHSPELIVLAQAQ